MKNNPTIKIFSYRKKIGVVKITLDLDSISLYQSGYWTIGGNRYLQGPMEAHHQQQFHRIVKSAEKGQLVDHINGDTLDNRSANLRLCTHAQNSLNKRKVWKSGYRGVSRAGRKWKASITVSGVLHKIGVYETKELARAGWLGYVKALNNPFINID